MRERKEQQDDLLALLSYVVSTNMILIEIGSYAGESAEIFAKSGKFSTIVCIDPWLSDPKGDGKNSYKNMDIVEHKFDEVLARNNIIKKHKGTIDTFVKSDLFKELDGKIDMVYIDGLHTYEGCKHDIQMCQKFIKPKFAFSGHDYTDQIAHVVGVKKAVDELFGKPDKTFIDNSWIKFI